MSVGSRYSSRQCTISYFQPLPAGGQYLGGLNISVQDWSHVINAFGGFETAEFRIVDHPTVMEEWFEEGVGRPIVTSDDAGNPMWEGFVNEVTIQQAGYQVTRGPLTNVRNRLHAVYSTIDTTQNPPVPGIRKATATVNDTESQSKYGLWSHVLSLAGTTDTDADQLRDTYLEEHRLPELANAYAIGQETTTVLVKCLGWVHTLMYPYNQTASSGTINLSTKIQNILTAQVNAWVSTDYGRIASNTLAVKAYENDDQYALDLIRGLVAHGDSSENRYLFGVYENRRAVYEAASTQVDYEVRLGDPRRTILDKAGGEVPPWRVRPGRWVFFSDFLPGRPQSPLNLREDPRMLFIESLRYDLRLPQGIDWQGGKISRFEQKLARLGLGGTSV